jgi:hypothetical protein
MDNTLACLKDIISTYENNTLSISKDVKAKKIKYTNDDFEWIQSHCDFTFVNDELHCINKHGKKFLIPKNHVHKFVQFSQWEYKLTIITNFSKSRYDFNLKQTAYFFDLAIKIDDYEIEFHEYAFNCIELTNKRLCQPYIKFVNSNYIIVLEIPITRNLEHVGLVLKYKDMHLVLHNLNNYIYMLFSRDITKYFEYVVDFNCIQKFNTRLIVSGKLKCEFNDILVEQNGSDGKYINFTSAYNLFQTVTQEIDPLDKKIYEQSKSLSILIKQRNENKETKKYYEQRKIARLNYSKCMEEIKNNKFVGYDKLLPRLHCDTRNKLIRIWVCCTFAEFEKMESLTYFESNIAEYLYSLNKNDRERKLLDNEIY